MLLQRGGSVPDAFNSPPEPEGPVYLEDSAQRGPCPGLQQAWRLNTG